MGCSPSTIKVLGILLKYSVKTAVKARKKIEEKKEPPRLEGGLSDDECIDAFYKLVENHKDLQPPRAEEIVEKTASAPPYFMVHDDINY